MPCPIPTHQAAGLKEAGVTQIDFLVNNSGILYASCLFLFLFLV